MNKSIMRGVILICFLLLIFVGNFIIDNKKDENYTNIEGQYQCNNCVVYPYKYYRDKEKKLVQAEFYEVNYSGKDSKISMDVFDENNNKIKIRFINNAPQKNPYNSITERKYIVQFNAEKGSFYTFNLLQNGTKLYYFKIDIDDFKTHTLIKKHENYFKEMEMLRENNSMEEYKKMKDTDFIEHDLLIEDEVSLSEK